MNLSALLSVINMAVKLRFRNNDTAAMSLNKAFLFSVVE